MPCMERHNRESLAAKDSPVNELHSPEGDNIEVNGCCLLASGPACPDGRLVEMDGGGARSALEPQETFVDFHEVVTT